MILCAHLSVLYYILDIFVCACGLCVECGRSVGVDSVVGSTTPRTQPLCVGNLLAQVNLLEINAWLIVSNKQQLLHRSCTLRPNGLGKHME